MARTTADKSGPFDVLDVEGLRAAFNHRFGRVWTAVQIEPGVVTKGDRADAWWLMVLTPNELTIEPIQLQGEHRSQEPGVAQPHRPGLAQANADRK